MQLRPSLVGVLALGTFAAFAGQAVAQQQIWVEVPGAKALTTGEPFEGTAEETRLWFVELQSVPLSEVATKDRASHATKLEKERNAFRDAATRSGIRFKERYSYGGLWNGLSVEVEPGDEGRLSLLPGVVASYPVLFVRAPEPEVPGLIEPNMFSALEMTGASVAQVGGLTGAGVPIGIIDTGIDYNHPDLGGPGFPNSRVVGGYDFVGDLYCPGCVWNCFPGPCPPDMPVFSQVPVPNGDPMDCVGHGTHVAGIAGADGTYRVTGVAPRADLYAYKVFSCAGITTTDIVLAAMERALEDSVQVVNMSLGASYQWPQYPTAQAADRLVNHGVIVVASAGNDGSTGTYSMSAPGVGKKVIAAGSVDNKAQISNRFSLPPDTFDPKVECKGWDCWCTPPWYYYRILPNSPPFPDSGTEPVVYVPLACNQNPLTQDVSGKVVMVYSAWWLGFDNRSPPCEDIEQAVNLAEAGATAVLFYAEHWYYDKCWPQVTGFEKFPVAPIPVGAIGGIGRIIKAKAPLALTWGKSDPVSTGGWPSSFSSWGPTPELDLKPDVMAPGKYIYSTSPLPNSDPNRCYFQPRSCQEHEQWYWVMSGTSMASPHVAGAVALLLQQNPRINSEVARDILQNNATPVPAGGTPQPVYTQGAGLLNIGAATKATTKITPGRLALGESSGSSLERSLLVENKGPVGQYYDFGHQWAAPQAGTVTFSPTSLYVPAAGTATVRVGFSPPAGLADRWPFGGYITLTPRDGGAALRVPYLALKGDYQSIVAMNPAASSYGNPLLRPSRTWGPNQPVTINLGNGSTSDDLAWIWINLKQPVRVLRMEVFAASTGRSWGRAAEFPYFSRSSGSGTFWTFSWGGATSKAVVPSGTYVMKVSVLKALGDDENPADWETWTSPPITLIR